MEDDVGVFLGNGQETSSGERAQKAGQQHNDNGTSPEGRGFQETVRQITLLD
jgi:hypothetical protein